MASLFAGIPLEGAGSRPLEADLYAAEGQLSDVENIAGTGNLNIGNVIQYDEQVQRHMSGGNLAEEGLAPLPQLSRGPANFLPEAADRSPAFAGDNSNTMQNTTVSRPDVQSMNAPRSTIAEQDNAGQTAEDLSVSAPPTQIPTNQPPGGSSAINTSSNTEITNSYNTTTTYNNTTYNYYNSSHGILNIYNNGSLIDIDNVLNNNTFNLSNLINLGDMHLINISDIEINNVLNNLLGGGGGDCCVADLLVEVVGGVTNIAVGVTNVLDGAVNVLGDVLGSTTILTGGITNVLGGTVNNTLNTLGSVINNVVDNGVGDTLNIVTDVVQNVTNIITPVTDLVDNVLDGGVLGGHSLLDLNANVLTNAFPAADDNALINGDISLLGLTHNTPNAAGLGLVDAEASLLSMPQNGADADGLSMTINTEVLGIDLLQNLPVIDIDVPLPTAQEVSPLLPPLIDDVLVNSNNLSDQLGQIIDPVVTLAALTETSNLATAIDAGVLFAGGSAGSGATAPVIAAPDVHLGDILAGGLFHH